MEYLASFIAVGVIGLLAAMSPGPDFAVVTKNSLFGSRKIGLFTALGVGAGILLHVTYSLLGIGFIISQSILLFSIIKYLGAAYLLYLGITLLRTKHGGTEIKEGDAPITATPFVSFREGFLTNALNPKATIFFVSIFTQVVGPETPLFVQALLGIEVAVIVGVWFSTLTLLITVPAIKRQFGKVHAVLMKLMGGALIYFGIKLALDQNK